MDQNTMRFDTDIEWKSYNHRVSPAPILNEEDIDSLLNFVENKTDKLKESPILEVSSPPSKDINENRTEQKVEEISDVQKSNQELSVKKLNQKVQKKRNFDRFNQGIEQVFLYQEEPMVKKGRNILERILDAHNESLTNQASNGEQSITNDHLTDINEQKAIVPLNNTQAVSFKINDHIYVDVTPYYSIAQHEAASIYYILLKSIYKISAYVGLPSSTFSKRWKETCPGRKWPYREITKIEKQLTSMIISNVDPEKSALEKGNELLLLLCNKLRFLKKPAAIRIS